MTSKSQINAIVTVLLLLIYGAWIYRFCQLSDAGFERIPYKDLIIFASAALLAHLPLAVIVKRAMVLHGDDELRGHEHKKKWFAEKPKHGNFLASHINVYVFGQVSRGGPPILDDHQPVTAREIFNKILSPAACAFIAVLWAFIIFYLLNDLSPYPFSIGMLKSAPCFAKAFYAILIISMLSSLLSFVAARIFVFIDERFFVNRGT